MKFIIRADASLQIGSGHIMRCLSLAKVLREQGHSIRFISRKHTGHLGDFVAQQGFECILLPEISPNTTFVPPQNALTHAAWLGTSQAQDVAECLPYLIDFSPDYLICDHYALDAEWERAAVAATHAKLLVIDDLHDRRHVADILLDQNLGHSAANYIDLIEQKCHVLAGTRYALLRDEFAQWRERSLIWRTQISGCPQHILINLGGVDKDNHTLTILKTLEKHQIQDQVTVVMGKTAPHIAAVQAFADIAPFSCQVLVHTQNIAEWMAKADWAIGAAGSTSWERCCLGLPTILLVIADNQRKIAQQLQAVGVAYALESNEIASQTFSDMLAHIRQPENLLAMSQRASTLCDGLGAKRVANYLIQQDFSGCIRPAQLADSRLLYTWRNHADIRRFMLHTDEIAWETHEKWYVAQETNPDYILLIYQENDIPLGSLNFTRVQNNLWEWGFYAAPNAPRGTGTKMGRLALAYAFSELAADEVSGHVLPHNVASLRLHEKLGFVRQPENGGSLVHFRLRADTFLW
ncbi:UDP-2,4-diacetamido-2,4,6-trideoxy-beta-L-altropyranose hydrolase [Wielerella bovis]|uniref:UDP-2,4-diacetamido-2,4, 6-trideoxy-beta-L-altropyranose hydrolase n=1 Tax=Wielerella bovis TaxID=2917790 RepID=UPI0020198DD5|nr:UDP-2,4-diacetamido-2,4,6-trideoxy-beta-L-altropyranose hydrolase [Wielerella bovis]MCG7657650.1 UDP-2,4-diacetamido-2,4,6-trideoxy-beta-L-altropyranose hydrolase [Wielerella bovis]MCG7659871.1 UDP-2,4-diacetamido-2,4,6-trideoxy-beta-L-altropyranose hydrolase [Wielerella bovis]